MKYENFFIILGLFLKSVKVFLLSIISQKIIITNLESLITTRAFTSSLFENINKEINIESAVLQIIPMHFSANSYVYLSIVVTFLYSYWHFYDVSEYNRFNKIEIFSRKKKLIKNILFVLILVFMKDIEYAC